MVELNDILKLENQEDKKLNEAVISLFNFDEEEDIKTKTDLTLRDIQELTKLKIIAKYFGIEILDSLCENYCLYLVSNRRLGRTEVVNLMKTEIFKEEEKEKRKPFFRLNK